MPDTHLDAKNARLPKLEATSEMRSRVVHLATLVGAYARRIAADFANPEHDFADVEAGQKLVLTMIGSIEEIGEILPEITEAWSA